MHKTNLQGTEVLDLLNQTTEQINSIEKQNKGIELKLDIILSRLNEQYLKEQEKLGNIKPHKPLTASEKEELDFNPLAYLEHKGLLSLSDYESDLNFIQEVVDNYIRLGLHEFKVCIHNVIARVNNTRKTPIGNMRAYIKSSLNKHVIRG